MGNIYNSRRRMVRTKLQKLIEETKVKTLKELEYKQNRGKHLKKLAYEVMDVSKQILEERDIPNDESLELLSAIKELDESWKKDNFETIQDKIAELKKSNDRFNLMYQETKDKINESDCFGIYEAYKLITESPITCESIKEKGLFFEILNILASSKKGHPISCIYQLIRDGEILNHPYCTRLLRKVSLTNSVLSSDCLVSLVKRHSLGKKDIHIAEIIVSYRSLSRLVSVHDKMFNRHNGLLEDSRMRDLSLKTFEHFKDNPDSNAGLFGCLDLYEEETDPTIERQLGQIYGEVLSLPHHEQILALKRAELALDYTKREV